MEEQKIRTKETKSHEEGIARMSSEKKNITENTVQQQSQSQPQTSVTLVAKWGKERITMDNLSPSTTLGQVKEIITEKTKILPKRQKLMGLTLDTSKKSGTTSAGKGLKLTDETVLMDLKVKKKSNNLKTNPSFNEEDMINVIRHDFILMGTPEEQIFVDPSDVDDLPEVIDDFDLDFSAGSNEWVQHVANGENLRKFTESTIIHVMNEPREDKPLLVLDLDHTLLDFSSKRLQEATTHEIGASTAAAMKRPYMDEFLTSAYRHYDLVVWSQTSWRWLEVKLTELGMLTNPGYRFCFVLDKTSMFSVTSTKRDGRKYRHYVKPLQLIWSKFPDRWGAHNSVHLDDLSRNFALNIGSGLKVSAFHRKKSSSARDTELSGLAMYLSILAEESSDFEAVDFRKWLDVVRGETTLSRTIMSKKSSAF